MGIGTAGFTAMLCIMALEKQGLDHSKEVVVTGAAGGVGSVAVSILANLGYKVVASTGRASEAEYLRSLGAAEILDRSLLSEESRPMESERFGGAIDTVGASTLAGVIARMAYGASVAATGLAGGGDLNTTVYPFILRGVNLLGIDSVMCPKAKRLAAWQRLAQDLPRPMLEATMQTVGLGQAQTLAPKMRVEGPLKVLFAWHLTFDTGHSTLSPTLDTGHSTFLL
jgi:acrylyl-CoA reductase (NADPH)